MSAFRPIRSTGGVSVELGTWPEGVIETQYIRVGESAWKSARFSDLRQVFFFDEPEIHSYEDAFAALQRAYEFAVEVANAKKLKEGRASA